MKLWEIELFIIHGHAWEEANALPKKTITFLFQKCNVEFLEVLNKSFYLCVLSCKLGKNFSLIQASFLFPVFLRRSKGLRSQGRPS